MNSIHNALGRHGQNDKDVIRIKEDVFYRFLAVAEVDAATSEMMANAHLLRTLARFSDTLLDSLCNLPSLSSYCMLHIRNANP